MRLNHKAAAVVASLAVMAGGTGVAYAASCPGMGGTGTGTNPTSTTGTTTTGTTTTGTTTSSSTTNAPRLAHRHALRHAGRL